MLHAALWDANRDLAEACGRHPFVRGLGDGTLERAAFQRYIAQDAFYLRAFWRAYALALAKVADPEHARTLHALIGGVLDELTLHHGYAARLGLDLEHVRPLPACAAYTDFLLRTGWECPPGVILAAMTPCVRLYAWIGQQLRPASPPGNPYAEWIATYSHPQFEALAGRIEGLLDALAADAPAVRAAYRYAMQCELGFFQAPLEAPG
jgi:thiaminase/transcriptional activator TenA